MVDQDGYTYQASSSNQVSQTNAGTYPAKAKLKKGYTWDDGAGKTSKNDFDVKLIIDQLAIGVK